MTTRATKRGAERTSLDGTEVDVLICGASFAGLAVARELALGRAAGAATGSSRSETPTDGEAVRELPTDGEAVRVLILDRYEIGERATSACAVPTPWLEAMGATGAARQELPDMTFTTPHGRVRCRLPWSWTAFDYAELCRALWAQAGTARFETAKVEGRDGGSGGGNAAIAVRTDRGTVRARLVVDALGWRRVLSEPHYQPPDAPLSRGLEVHPHLPAAGDQATGALDVWVERGVVRRGYAWRVPAGREARIGVGSYDPRRHVKAPTVALAERLQADPVRFQGNWFPHRLRPATEDGVFFVGDSAGHCFPLSGEGIRTAFYFGIACGRELRGVLDGERPRDAALARYHAFSAAHARPFAVAGGLQRLVPALPPRLLTALLRLLARGPLVDRAFGWYLDQAHPRFATSRPG
jgi:menaquinone-9 beta-reductase